MWFLVTDIVLSCLIIIIKKDDNSSLFYDVIYKELIDDPIDHLTAFLQRKLIPIAYSTYMVSSDNFVFLFYFLWKFFLDILIQLPSCMTLGDGSEVS